MRNIPRSFHSEIQGAAGEAVLHKSINAHFYMLCSKIGDRRAGSPGDRMAADYILEQFRAAGLPAVYSEAFYCVWVVKAEAEIAMGTGPNLRNIPARVLAGSPST